MSTSRKVQSFDAGVAAHAEGKTRDTFTSNYFIDRAAWLAGWDDAAYLATQEVGTLDDIVIELPTRAPAALRAVHDVAAKRYLAPTSRTEAVRAVAKMQSCAAVFQGHHLVVYAPGGTHRFAIALDGVCVNGRIVGDILTNHEPTASAMRAHFDIDSER